MSKNFVYAGSMIISIFAKYILVFMKLQALPVRQYLTLSLTFWRDTGLHKMSWTVTSWNFETTFCSPSKSTFHALPMTFLM